MLDNNIFTVSEFNEFIDLLVSQEEVRVEGEISEINVSQRKWLFATIKDKEAAVEVFGIASHIKALSVLETGMLVQVFGRPRLHKRSGRFRIWAEQIVPAGEGALKIAFEKLKQKLFQEGLFDEARKRSLPPFPKKIGLITAKGSRAYSDFVKILKERLGGLEIHFYPVQVQGLSSEKTIIKAFEYFNRTFEQGEKLDLLVLTRGGGSLEDLMAFNSEEVARAIFAAKMPVVCGVGHEDNVTLADLVADVRASTPSNAAEIIVRERSEVEKEIMAKLATLQNYLSLKINAHRSEIKILNNRLSNVITHRLRDLEKLTDKLLKAPDYLLWQAKEALAGLAKLLNVLDYEKILARGFSLTAKEDGTIIKDSTQVKRDDKILTRVYKGKISSRVV